MQRRGLFVLGVLLLVSGVSMPSLAYFHQVSDRGLTPIDVAADLSGASMTITFTAERTDSYEAYVAMTLPSGATVDSPLLCLLRSPDAENSYSCKAPGQLAVTAAITDGNGVQLNLNEPSSPIEEEIVGGSKITVKRRLGFFNTIAGHRNVITAHIRSEDPTIRRLRPRLTAFINDPGIYESIALTHLIFVAAMIIGAIFLAVGAVLLVIVRRTQKPKIA
jgi:hypothetical protein